MGGRELIVLKFGSSVLRGARDVGRIAREIERWLERGADVVAVVSAFRGVTDRLMAQGRRYGPDPDGHALAALVATGELASAATLGLGLRQRGIACEALDQHGLGLVTEGPPIGARAVGLCVERVRRALAESRVIVAPGFIGRCAQGRTTLLARGGSDFSAVFLAHHLTARCRLIKDTGGLYERDPALGGVPVALSNLTWEEAARLECKAVQGAALEYAREHGIEIEIAGLGSQRAGTIIGREALDDSGSLRFEAHRHQSKSASDLAGRSACI